MFARPKLAADADLGDRPAAPAMSNPLPAHRPPPAQQLIFPSCPTASDRTHCLSPTSPSASTSRLPSRSKPRATSDPRPPKHAPTELDKANRKAILSERHSLLAQRRHAEGEALRAALASGRISAHTVLPAAVAAIVDEERRKWDIPSTKRKKRRVEAKGDELDERVSDPEGKDEDELAKVRVRKAVTFDRKGAIQVDLKRLGGETGGRGRR